MDNDNTKTTAPRRGGVVDTGTGTEAFGVTQSIAPNSPVKRRPGGRVDFPGGVTLLPPEARSDRGQVHVSGMGFLTEGVARQIAASIAGALVELASQREREARRAASHG